MAQRWSGGQSLITIETSESEKDPSKKSENKAKELLCIGNSFSFFLVFESFSDPIETRETFVKAIHH